MKQTIFKSLLCAFLGAFVVSNAIAEERVVATVNGQPILQSQVNAAMGKRGDFNAALD